MDPSPWACVVTQGGALVASVYGRQLVIFEQNMPESSESTGRLVKRKHTLGLHMQLGNHNVSMGACISRRVVFSFVPPAHGGPFAPGRIGSSAGRGGARQPNDRASAGRPRQRAESADALELSTRCGMHRDTSSRWLSCRLVAGLQEEGRVPDYARAGQGKFCGLLPPPR